ncbi:PRC-barrel domain-containing protein [Sphingomonas canadensis]|uniref:PRC-barrel domain-containing protein n=1 Tax=Sphingomonas canadensis TaxID=1219257 RepID=A0ABW3H6L2_9SPHN|nr:PRC-barrel domain-containing protein [Sphingomonas canadensis]MCW3836783.1 PRC-barrel domain-containing protein [Sphingomonas canadensis]
MHTETHVPDRLIASDRVEGTAVYDPAGERLGTVERFMVDKASGQAEYAVLGFGGLFGFGNRHYPLPWKALTYDTGRGGYVVNVSKEQIEGAPSYETGEEPRYDRDYDARVYGYYGILA